MSRKAKRQFELEALEPRVLLSGDGLIAAAVPLAGHVDEPAFIKVEEKGSRSGLDASVAYDPSAQINDVFAGVSGTEVGSELNQPSIPAPPPPGAGTAEAAVADSPAGSASPAAEQAADSHASGGEASDNVGSKVDELTDTLHAANAPPNGSGKNIVLALDGDSASSGNLVLGSQDTLSGTGTVHGSFVNNGLLSPGHSPGLITVENSFSQGPDGTTLIEIGGTSGPGVNPSGHDSIDITGDINLDGTVRIALFNGKWRRIGRPKE